MEHFLTQALLCTLCFIYTECSWRVRVERVGVGCSQRVEG